ncbi:MAG: porin, partial [Aquimonas sp.]
MAHLLRAPARRALPLALGLGLAGLSSSPGFAQAPDPALANEVAALRAELERLQARVSELEARSAEARSVAPPAATASAETVEIAAGPGLEIASETAERSFGIGGRLHYDFYAHNEGARAATGGSEFRRARVNFDGEAAGWAYRLQVELSGDAVDLRDVYLERALGANTLTLGQFKPHRSMEELGSSNDLSVMERGYTSAAGLFAERQWQQGAGFLMPLRAGSLGVSVFTLREDDTARNEGWGAAARATWAPVREDTRVLHFGLWGSEEQGGRNTPS